MTQAFASATEWVMVPFIELTEKGYSKISALTCVVFIKNTFMEESGPGVQEGERTYS